jgi:hypothetical protein
MYMYILRASLQTMRNLVPTQDFSNRVNFCKLLSSAAITATRYATSRTKSEKNSVIYKHEPFY